MPSGHSHPITRSLTTAFKLVMVCAVFYSTTAIAQDSPGRFEVGGNFTALRFESGGFFGPGVEGDINFGRHFALDGGFSWLPSGTLHVMTGLFGAKVGTRREHFGFFGKVRPGFISFGDVLRQDIITITTQPGPSVSSFTRLGRLTERALDLGGVMEYYPSRHWALRWDIGDTVLFGEQPPNATLIVDGVTSTLLNPLFPHGTTHNFQFSTGVHYRF
jgi:hypothetical protein